MFKKLVSTDCLKLEFGNFFNIIGVAIEFRDYFEFRKVYFDIVCELKEKYGLKNIPKVIKKKTVSKYVPSYVQREFIKEFVETLISCDIVSCIQITETFIKDCEIKLPYSEKMIKGSKFARDILPHYYPLVPLWKYLQNYGDDAVKNFVIDHVDGYITNVWSEIGRKAENVVIVPHGDETYPCISICDLMCEYIRRMVHRVRAKEIKEYFKKELKLNDGEADFIADLNLLIPKYPYSINPQNFYPHPILFIECTEIGYEVDKNKRKAIIEDSSFYRQCLEFAERMCGCVTFFDVTKHQSVLTGKDLIICLDEQAYNRVLKILQLNKTVGFKVLNLNEAYEILSQG